MENRIIKYYNFDYLYKVPAEEQMRNRLKNEDLIDQGINKQSFKITKQTYNLEKGLSFEVKSMQKYFKFNEN